MTPFLGEVIGTALLILLGNGVVANVVLKGYQGKDSGWIVDHLGLGHGGVRRGIHRGGFQRRASRSGGFHWAGDCWQIRLGATPGLCAGPVHWRVHRALSWSG